MLETTNSLVLKGRPWSQSRLSQAEQCALRFYWEHVNKSLRRWRVAKGDGRVGRAAHWILEQRVMGKDASIEELMRIASVNEALTHPEAMDLILMRDGMETFAGRFHAWRERYGIPREAVEAEKKMGLAQDGRPAPFFPDPKNPPPFFRGVLDVVAFSAARKTVVILDHKTGSKKPMEDHAAQLQIYALMGFAHYPEADSVMCAIHWLRSGEIEFRPQTYKRSEFTSLLGWVQAWVKSVEMRLDAIDGVPEPEVGFHCQWCEFVGKCPSRTGVPASNIAPTDHVPAPAVPADEKQEE